MDIKQFAVAETGTVELVDAADAPLMGDDDKQMTITVYGPGSKTFARAQALQSNRMLDRLKRKGKADQTAEEKAKEQAEFLAAVTKEFSPNIEYDGLAGEALYKAVYSDISIGFIAEQVAKHLQDWGNFRTGSQKP